MARPTRIWFLTRSWWPSQTGGVLVRDAQVQALKKLADVHIVTPDYGGPIRDKDATVHRIPYLPSRFSQRLYGVGERLGVIPDYLSPWARRAFSYLKDKVQAGDLVFATTGGEIGCFQLGVMLKQATSCRLVFNYHDPVTYTSVNGLVIDDRIHIRRDTLESQYLKYADWVFTSSKTQLAALIQKNPLLVSKSECAYFGWAAPVEPLATQFAEPITLAFAGTLTRIQGIEHCAEVVARNPRFRMLIIGNWRQYTPIQAFADHPHFSFHDSMSYEKCHAILKTQAHLGFVSLDGEYFGACFPSKIFEYINLGLPIFGALPEGDAKEVINSRGYGIATKNDVKSIEQALEGWSSLFWEQCKNKIAEERESWSLVERQSSMVARVRELLSQKVQS